MIEVGFFSEAKLFADNGSIKDYLTENIDYDKESILNYLKSFSHFSSCPKSLRDCVTGKIIRDAVLIYNDGTFCWSDVLTYHISNYRIKLPDDFIQHILNNT